VRVRVGAGPWEKVRCKKTNRSWYTWLAGLHREEEGSGEEKGGHAKSSRNGFVNRRLE
jgi:hypothetical protein